MAEANRIFATGHFGFALLFLGLGLHDLFCNPLGKPIPLKLVGSSVRNKPYHNLVISRPSHAIRTIPLGNGNVAKGYILSL